MRGLTADQHSERNKGLGGSDAKRVMDGAWNALWLEKTGRAKPENLDWVIPVQIGQAVSDNLQPARNFLFTQASDPEFVLFNWKVSWVALGLIVHP